VAEEGELLAFVDDEAELGSVPLKRKWMKS
jgi:hypothetical protein